MADGLQAIGSRRHFEYIVVGCGGIGSGAVYWLSKKAPGDRIQEYNTKVGLHPFTSFGTASGVTLVASAHEVLGLEQFEVGHNRGGSQDVSRGIRLAYHEDCYAKLAPAMYEAWAQVERESGLQLVFKSGSIQLCDRGSSGVLETYMAAMESCNIPFERLTNEQLRARYPQFTTGPNIMAFYQKDGGIVDAQLGNSTHLQLARGNGAFVIDRCPVLRIRKNSAGKIEVTTPKATFTCRKLVVTSGAWLNDVLGTIGVHIPVTVTQEQVTYFATPHIKEFTKDRFPIWCYHSPKYDIYTMPIHNNSGTKIGIDASGPAVTGHTRTFDPDPARLKICTDFLKKTMPKFLGPEMFTKTCLYTLTKDRHFVVDNCRHKGFPDVVVCCGAGHAYKFASLLGKILSEMAVDGKTQYDISQFSLDRPAITDPNYKQFFQCGSKQPSKL